MDPMSIGTFVVAVAAAVIAIWQGSTSRKQLQLARATQGKTEGLLEEIREIAKDGKRVSEETKASVDERIKTLLDLRVEQERANIEMGNKFSQALLGAMFQQQQPGTGENPPPALPMAS